MRSAAPLAGLLLSTCLLLGCATPQLRALQQQWPQELPASVLLAHTPFIEQADYQCGPASLAMLARSAGLSLTAEQLRPQVYLPGRQGSLQPELLAAARRQGLLAYRLSPQLQSLLQELAAGHPVLVFQNLGLDAWPVWHYAVLIGYERERGELILHSGPTAQARLSLSTFERTWARAGHWAMLALPPEQLPASAEPLALTHALAALERSQPAAARRGYVAALQRWPEDALLLMGAGNSAYALQDRQAAAAAYRRAVQAQPRLADGWNNLAQVLMELGQRAEARAAIAQALALGGPRQAQYRELAQQLSQP